MMSICVSSGHHITSALNTSDFSHTPAGNTTIFHVQAQPVVPLQVPTPHYAHNNQSHSVPTIPNTPAPTLPSIPAIQAPFAGTSTPSPAQKDFEVLLHVIPPPKKASGARKAKKTVKVEPVPYGPINADTSMSWEELIKVIVDTLGTLPPFLVLNSMDWKFLKSANAPWLPLRSASTSPQLD